MSLNQKAFCTTSIGQVINLITNDVHQLESHLSTAVAFPLAGIFQMIFSVTILLHVVGMSCLVGIFAMLLFLAIQGK